MSKAVKTVIGVVAAVAIPFVAPSIAATIGLSGAIGGAVGSATAGTVLGGALTGAALGAAKGALLGDNVGRSALLGGLGGGIGGYLAAPAAPSPYALATTPPTAGLTPTEFAPPSYALTSAPPSAGGLTVPPGSGLSGALGTATGEAMGGTGLTLPSAFGPTGGAGAGTGLSATTGFGNVDYSLAAGSQVPSVGLSTTGGGVGLTAASAPTGFAPGAAVDYSLSAGMQPSQGLTTGTGATPVMTASAGGAPATFAEAIKKVPGEIAAKFQDPKALADLTLRAGGMLAGSLVAGTGLSDAEQALLDAQTAELRNLQQTNAGLFAQRLEQAQNLIGESRYFDPEYFGLQRARRAQTAGARAKTAGLRGLSGATRTAESRRFDLATARDVGTAYDQGYLTGVQGRLGTIQAGLNAMPSGYPSSMTDYSGLRQAYGGAAERARQTQRDIGDLFGSVVGRNQATSRG